MQAVRDGCEATIQALKKDGVLSPKHSLNEATDILWMMLSVRNWEQLTRECGWSQSQYINTMKAITIELLVIKSDNV